MIKFVGLTKCFGDLKAVDDLNFEIAEGEIFGFVGSNGAGKSTTIKIATGLMKPTEGTIYIDGIDIREKNALFRSKIGYVPDFFGVYDQLKVNEYMNFYCGLHKIPIKHREELIRKLTKLVNLEDKAEEYVDSLSRGMKQRLCLARALIHDPKILIMDEPASGLDPRARIDFRNILYRLKGMDKTIIISSHILSELAEICTSIGIIEKGRMMVKGSVNEIQKKLSHLNRITIKCTSGLDEVMNSLREIPDVSEIKMVNGNLEFSFAGTDEDKVRLLKLLVEKDIPIFHFEEKGGSLESIFLQVTKEEKADA
ncbi:MAG: ABC transporter ATP-binding protein [Bacillota bacterium]|nr:ABC transporter ATP-binding protein [Bacillota bacterium]